MLKRIIWSFFSKSFNKVFFVRDTFLPIRNTLVISLYKLSDLYERSKQAFPFYTLRIEQ